MFIRAETFLTICFSSVFSVPCFARWKTQNVNGRQNIMSQNTLILRSHQGTKTALFSGDILDAGQWAGRYVTH
jgi:hypothetical protein